MAPSRREKKRLEKKRQRREQARRARAGRATTPRCSVVESCGGCQLQHVFYGHQLRDKDKALRRALGEVCGAADIEPIRGLSSPYGYRTRLTMPAAPASREDGRSFELGFYAPGTTQLIPAEECPVQHPLALSTLAGTIEILARAPVVATAPKTRGGWLHGITVRVDPTLESAEVTLVARDESPPGGSAWLTAIAELPAVTAVHISINPARSSYLSGQQFVHVAGAQRCPFSLGGATFELSPGSFLQTCAEAAELLVATVLNLMPATFGGLADLYGGVGVFSRLSSGRWQRATVVESNPHAVADLRHYLGDVDDTGLEVIEARVEDVIDAVLAKKPDVVVVDPPRRGCHPRVIESLGRSAVPTILYVACGLEALAADARALVEAGYVIDKVEAVDMFPHTAHVEAVVRLRRRDVTGLPAQPTAET